jgi:hypothetical protein
MLRFQNAKFELPILPKSLFRKISRDPGLMPRVPERSTVQMISDFATSQVEISPVRSRGLNLVHFLADPTTVGPLCKI